MAQAQQGDSRPRGGEAMRDGAGTGVFVSFEGADGVGKSTQVEALARRLRDAGVEVVSLREPGGTAISEKIRQLVLSPESSDMCDECELLLFEAARAQLVGQVIRPALRRGAVVLCDRFMDSTYAYQAGGRCMDEDVVRTANRLGSCGVVPQRTLVLDLDPSSALARATATGADRLEAEGVRLQERVRAAYLRLAQLEAQRVRVVDASGTMEQVAARVEAALADVIPALAGQDAEDSRQGGAR